MTDGRMDMWVVDLETTGLDHRVHVVLEVAAVNLRTGEHIEFVPYVKPEAWSRADPVALQVNRYFERCVFKRALDSVATEEAYRELFGLLSGCRFGGANPRFDALMLQYARGAEWQFGGCAPESWHYRLSDVCAYTAGALGMEPDDIPGLHQACGLLGVENVYAHSALSDARATAECFRRAHQIRTNAKELNAQPS